MWKANEDNIITVTAKEDTEHKAYYKVRGSSDSFVEISGDFEYMGDDIHELVCSFEEGNYIIRVNNMTTGGIAFTNLQVVAKTAVEEVCECSTNSANVVNDKIDSIAESQMELMLAVGGDVAETQTYIQSVDNGSMLV